MNRWAASGENASSETEPEISVSRSKNPRRRTFRPCGRSARGCSRGRRRRRAHRASAARSARDCRTAATAARRRSTPASARRSAARRTHPSGACRRPFRNRRRRRAVAIPVGDIDLASRHVDAEIGRAAEIRRVVAALGLPAAADLQQELSVERELEHLRVLVAVAGKPYGVGRVDEDAVLARGPLITGTGAAPRTHGCAAAEPTKSAATNATARVIGLRSARRSSPFRLGSSAARRRTRTRKRRSRQARRGADSRADECHSRRA